MKNNVIKSVFKRNYSKKSTPSGLMDISPYTMPAYDICVAAIRKIIELKKKEEEEEVFHRLCDSGYILFDEYSNDMEGY
jgi:hypothetical protein